MKKQFWRVLFLVFVLFFFVVITGCEKNPVKPDDNNPTENNENQNPDNPNPEDPNPEDPNPEDPNTDPDPVVLPVPDELKDVKFEDLTIPYDGKTHRLEATNLPDGATVTYNPTKKNYIPGEYTYEATVTLGSISYAFKAKLTITKVDFTVNVEKEQVVYLTDNYGIAKPNYTLSNPKARVVLSPTNFTKPGVYKVVISAEDSKFYNPIEPIEITVTVKSSRIGYHLDSKTIVINDGETATLLLEKDADAQDLDLEKYEVVYTNNVQTEQGIYHVTAQVKDKATGEVVEEFRAILTVDYPENEEFQAYAEEMFVYLMEGDQSTINIFFVNPDNYGFEHYDAEWYTYEKYTEEQFNEDLEEIQRLRSEFDTFKDAKISYKQKLDYRIIDENITFYEELITSPNIVLMRLSYIDQYGGYAADFPTVLEAYSLRTVQDIDDALSYINSSYDAYMSYYEYLLDREEAGYPLAGFTLNGMAEYLEGVAKTVDDGSSYYLIGIFNEKLNQAKKDLNLSDGAVANYKEQFKKAFNEKFIPAHRDLAKKIRDYITEKGLDVKGYISYLNSYKDDGGVVLYEKMLKHRLGLTETTTKEAINYIDKEFTKFFNAWQATSTLLTNDAHATEIDDGKVKAIDTDDPLEIIAFCKEFAKTIVPELKNEPTISVTAMDKTVTANTTTLAYYMKSPLDSFDKEFIHLNVDALGNNHFETITTLAHEGYPGHLYAYCFAKESDKLSPMATIMTCTGHGEGWAKYVETCVAHYIGEINNDFSWQIAGDYENYYSLMAYLLEARIDLGVNYEGWSVSKVGSYLSSKGLNSSIAQDIFNTVNEAPTQIIAYGYGMAVFYEWHTLAKEVLGEYYNEIDFNVAMLEHGWCSLDTLDIYMEEYMANQKFLHNIVEVSE